MLELVRRHPIVWDIVVLKLKILLANASTLGYTRILCVCLRQMLTFIKDRMKLGSTTQKLVLALISLRLIKLCERLECALGSLILT